MESYLEWNNILISKIQPPKRTTGVLFQPEVSFNIKTIFPDIGIPMKMKDGDFLPGKGAFYTETNPWSNT